MRKLFEIRLGGGQIKEGLLPVEALRLIRDLLGAMAEEGGDPKAWRRANPHIEILGAGSTRGAVHTAEYQELVVPAALFVNKAGAKNLGRKGLEFVERRFRSDQLWEYLEITVCNGQRTRVRLDTEYREAVEEERAPIRSIDDLYARVIRVGGENPVTAKLEIGKQSGTYKVASLELGKKLAARLYETVKIRAEVGWDPKTLDIVELEVKDLDENWLDEHLWELMKAHDGRLPIELAVKSAEAIREERRKEREQL